MHAWEVGHEKYCNIYLGCTYVLVSMFFSWPHFATTIVNTSGCKHNNLGENKPTCNKRVVEIEALEDNNNILGLASWACVVHGGGHGDVVCYYNSYVVKLTAHAQGVIILWPLASKAITCLVQLLKAFTLSQLRTTTCNFWELCVISATSYVIHYGCAFCLLTLLRCSFFFSKFVFNNITWMVLVG